MLFAFSTAGLRSEKSGCNCSTACSLPCLQSESCSLLFNISAINANEFTLSGNFLISITSPKDQVVSSLVVSTSNLSQDPLAPNNFQLTVPPSICAGNYIVSFTNLSVPTPYILPFFTINVTNSCNANAISLPVPSSVLDFISALDGGSSLNSLSIGESTEVKVYIPETFVPFAACKSE